MAADMATKAPPAPPPPPSPWDVAITAALMTDYNFRGITQSNHSASTQAGFELRYTQSPTLQYYAGISGESIDFPNHAAAEIDFYGGFRPTFDKLALDFGFWYYAYPGGQCDYSVFGAKAGCNPSLANGNVAKQAANFYEWYGKATYTVNDQWAFGIQEWYSPSVANTGSVGWFTTGNATWTAPSTWFSNGVGMAISADLGYWALGKSDAFYGTGALFGFPGQTLASANAGDPYKSYWTWDVGVDFTWKAFTLDLRYYDTNLNKGDCNAFTSDYTAGSAGGPYVTAANPGGQGSNWCSAAFIAKLSFATNLSNIK
jgi:uncharacterized protein (TIGR02001 family)